ncbi:hypothetical protein [Marinicrinis sediminis]|uniref:Type II secretion system protein GspF domain-containing protein n=1 Tax=Marinicrinis sediminis TaxID=1652465 RepID=A0ABW5RCI2_9BACL
MLALFQYLLLGLFVLLAFTFSYSLIMVLYRTNEQRGRLHHHQRLQRNERDRDTKPDTASSSAGMPSARGVLRHLSDMLDALHSEMSLKTFVQLSMMLGLFGAVAGFVFFQQPRSMVLLSVMLVLIPYTWLRMKLVSLQIRRKEELLPALEIFYQCYITTMPGNIRTTLHETVQGEHLDVSMKRVFEKLHRDLITYQDVDEALRMFALSIGNDWSRHYAMMLKMALSEGIDIRENLKTCIADMRKAQREALRHRARLLEIRIANFTPLLFLGLFMGLNYFLDQEQAYRFYILDPVGRSMVLDGIWLIFASFVMGLYLSIKRM